MALKVSESERVKIEELNAAALLAIEALVTAMRYPFISGRAMNNAQAAMIRANAAALALDPPKEAA